MEPADHDRGSVEDFLSTEQKFSEKSAAVLASSAAEFDIGRRADLTGQAQGRIGVSAAWSWVMAASRYLVNMAATVILARVLAPSDYGLLAMATSFTVALQVFADLGLSAATVQNDALSGKIVDSCWWINTGFGALLGLVCVAVAPVTAAFYHRPELRAIMPALAIPFLLSGATVQPKALLERRMEFRTISLIETAALAAGAAVALGVAMGRGAYWALVSQLIATRVTALVLYFVSSRYFPSSFSWRPGVASFLRFGGYVAAFNTVFYFARNLDTIVIGKISGAASAGYYSRAHFLMTFPSFIAGSVLTPVMVPAMSALRSDLDSFARSYVQAVRWVCLIGVPLAIGIACTASDAIRLVYGEKWEPVVPLFLWLSVGGIVMPVQQSMGWLFLSAGEGRQLLLAGLGLSAFTALAVLIGARWGAQGVAEAFGVTTLATTIPLLYSAHRAADLSLHSTGRSVMPIFLAGLAIVPAVFVTGLLASKLAGLAWQIVFIVKISVGATTYLAGIKLLAPDLWLSWKSRVQRIPGGPGSVRGTP